MKCPLHLPFFELEVLHLIRRKKSTELCIFIPRKLISAVSKSKESKYHNNIMTVLTVPVTELDNILVQVAIRYIASLCCHERKTYETEKALAICCRKVFPVHVEWVFRRRREITAYSAKRERCLRSGNKLNLFLDQKVPTKCQMLLTMKTV